MPARAVAWQGHPVHALRAFSVLPFPDRPILMTGVVAGRSRLLVARPGQLPLHSVESDDRTSGPVALVGSDRVVSLIGEPPALLRLSPSGGEPREISLPAVGLAFAGTRKGSRAIRRDGLLAVALMPSNSCFWSPGVLDLRTGKAHGVPIAFEADAYQPSWTEDGALVAGASEYRTQIWRYRVGGRSRCPASCKPDRRRRKRASHRRTESLAPSPVSCTAERTFCLACPPLSRMLADSSG